MKKSEFIEALAKRAGLSVEKLSEALQADETDVQFTGKVFTDEDLETLKTNILKDNQATYEDAKKAGVEMAVKELKRELGYEFEGKDIKSLLTYHGKKIETEAGKEPTAKVKELKDELDKLRQNWQENEQKYKSDLEMAQRALKDYSINSKLLGQFKTVPQGLTVDDAVMIFKKDIEVKDEDGSLIFYRNGKKLTDDKMNPLPIEDVVNAFVSQRGWVQPDGRGGKNNFGSPTEFKTMDEAMKHMEENKIDPRSEAGQKIILQVQKA